MAIARVIPIETLRWISFGHLEADECGAMNLLLDAAPNAEVVHGPLACMLSLDGHVRPARRSRRAMAPLDIGGHRLRFIATPHVPHNWEAGLWFDETTSTLLAGDLFTHAGQCPAITGRRRRRAGDRGRGVLPRAPGSTPNLAPTLAAAGGLNPTTLAIMHGASYSGDGAAQLRALSDEYAAMLGASLQ